MKEKLKKNKILRKLVQSLKLFISGFEYLKDFFCFKKNYMYSNNSLEKLEYRSLLLIHSIEKGFIHNDIRPFGRYKVIELVDVLEKIALNNRDSFSFTLGVNILRHYTSIYEQNKWTDKEEYTKSNDFIKKYKNVKILDVSPIIIEKKNIYKDLNIDYITFLKSRHSARTYKKQIIKKEDIEYSLLCGINSPSACNRQMIKVYYIKDKKKKETIIKYGQGFSGFDIDAANILLITFDISSFSYIGERNQGYFNSGLFAMNFCNGLHSRGIGTCFVQFANKYKEEKKIKEKLGIPKSERIAVIISAGYYLDSFIVPSSTRKDLTDIYKEL